MLRLRLQVFRYIIGACQKGDLKLMEHANLTSANSSVPLDDEIRSRVQWLIRLRWIAAAILIAGTGVAAFIPGIELPWLQLSICGAAILAYNTLFMFILGRLGRERSGSVRAFSSLASAQFITDWLALTVIVHLTGGVGSPILFFFVFHAILASILLPPRSAWFHAAGGVALVGALVALEYFGVLEQIPVAGFFAIPARDGLVAAGMFGFFAATILVAVFLTGAVAAPLWRRTRELIQATSSLRVALDRTRTLNDISRKVSSSLDVQEVLDGIISSVIQVTGVCAGSIRLRDPDTGRWVTGAVSGLHADFMEEHHDNTCAVEGPCNCRLLSGEPVVVSDIRYSQGCMMSETMRRAGLVSMMAVPLRHADVSVGLLSLYTCDERVFDPGEVQFITTLAGQVVTAVENARAYRRLQNLDNAKTRFFYVAAHELKSPAAAVQSSLDLLMEGYLGELPANQMQIIERSHRRLAGLRALLADLMDMGSLGAVAEADLAPVDIGSVVGRVCEMLRLDADNKQISLDVTLSVERSLPAKEGHIERLVENLVGNAIKYTPGGGRVEVVLAGGRAGLVLTVADSGVGISADSLPHVFEEFYRAEGVKKSHEGTGLGLALVKRIVDRYGASIRVSSEPGKGTAFVVTWPDTVLLPESVSAGNH